MTEKRLCFIGLGSIAKRHIRNLRDISMQDGVGFSIDVVRRNAVVEEADLKSCISNVYTSLSQLTEYDAIYITNPTSMHFETLNKIRGKAGAYFIEKPVTDLKHLDEMSKAPYIHETNSYVACPLRYTRVIRYLKGYVKAHRVIGVRAMSSSYLPDWRPSQDYRQTYSAKKELGGGVAIDLIHEWDYLRDLFGMPRRVLFLQGKKSQLEINSEDAALYLAEYADKYVELHLDYFGRKTLRECMIFTDEDTIVADLAAGQIRFLKSGITEDFSENRDDYQKAEQRHFLEIVEGKPSDSTIAEGLQTLKLTQGIVDNDM